MIFGLARQSPPTNVPVGACACNVTILNLGKEHHKWPSHRSIRRATITIKRRLTIKPPHTITFRRHTITILVSMTKQENTQLWRSNTANKATSTPRLPTATLRSNGWARGWRRSTRAAPRRRWRLPRRRRAVCDLRPGGITGDIAQARPGRLLAHRGRLRRLGPAEPPPLPSASAPIARPHQVGEPAGAHGRAGGMHACRSGDERPSGRRRRRPARAGQARNRAASPASSRLLARDGRALRQQAVDAAARHAQALGDRRRPHALIGRLRRLAGASVSPAPGDR
jgi:hypothetical protein